MSLYYEATAILANKEKKGGSLKSRVYGDKSLKNAPSKLFALLVQSLKWSPILKEIIERSELLKIERRACVGFLSTTESLLT
jgi:putative methyltransferase